MVEKNLAVKVLQFLIENNTRSFSISEIAKSLNKDYKNIFNTIKKMHSIDIKKSAGASLISFNFTYSELLYQVEYKRKLEALKDKNLEIICKDVSKINAQYILLLFGSRAKKTNKTNSDYDLLLITDNAKKIEQQFELYPLNIHLNTITLDEFRQMLLSKEFTFVSEAVENNIILFGIEDYYRLLQNAN